MPCPCHLENRRKYVCAGRSAQLVLSVLLFFVALSLAQDAVARITTSSNSLSFGSVTVGTSLTLGVTLANNGTSSVKVSQATVTGAGFSVSGLVLPLTLNARQNATFNVEFAPAVGGSVTGAISIITNAWWNPTISISLSGTGVAQPTANLSPPSMTFASQALGTTSSAQAVTLTNSGGTTLNITSLALTGVNASDFAQTNTCGSSVAAGSNCTISVMFTPSVSGTEAASLSIADNASGSPQTVNLSGTGTGAVASLAPGSLAFLNQPVDMTSTAQSVTLSNTGNAALSITSLALTGTNASDFDESNTCGSSLAAGANCTIVVMFTPSVAGTEAASLSIADNSSGSPQTVSLSGAGTHDVILSWTASTTSGVVGYNVYRGTASGGESTTPLNSSPVAAGCTSTTTCTYTDATTVVAGTTYYYTVTAVASNDVTQSADSNEVSAAVP